MTTLYIEYDPYQGGFELRFGDTERVSSDASLAGNLMVSRHEHSHKITALWTADEQGGISLLGAQEFGHHGVQPYPEERLISLNRDETRIGPIRIVQSADDLTLWFGEHLATPDDALHTDMIVPDAVWVTFITRQPDGKPLVQLLSARFTAAALHADFPLQDARVEEHDFQ